MSSTIGTLDDLLGDVDKDDQNSIALHAERKLWKANCHISLYTQQKLVAYKGCHSTPEGQVGWVSGWLTCSPPAEVTVEFDQPIFLTKVSMVGTNILSSPRTMELWYSQSMDSEWVLGYHLSKAQCNRLGLLVPGNTDASDNESSSVESFYLFGHCYNNSNPKLEGRLIIGSNTSDQDLPMIANKGLVKHRADSHTMARFWKIKILDTNGSNYVGINNFVFFGVSSPLAAPDNVRVSVPIMNGESVFRICWEPVPSHRVSSYSVVAFANGIGRGSGGFIKSCEASQTSVFFENLSPNTQYVFFVVAVDGNNIEGLPSKVTAPMSISELDWEMVQLEIGARLEISNKIIPDTRISLSAQQLDTGEGRATAVDHPSVTNAEVIELPSWQILSTIPSSETKRSERALLRKMASVSISDMQNLSVSDYHTRFQESIEQLCRGFFNESRITKVASQVSLFISSTFDDTTAERNYFMEHAYPLLHSYCQSRGLHFAVADLRWGLQDSSTDDHMTIDICLSEVDRCMKTSTAAGFVFLSGERYGWRALPNRVSADEFNLVVSLVKSTSAEQVIRDWYLCDENSEPPVYILQRISKMKARTDIPGHNDFWGSAQGIIQTSLRSALAADPGISDAIKSNWGISVTEREVVKGILGRDDCQVEVDCIVLMRTINGLEQAVLQGDKLARNVFYTPLEDDRVLLHLLRDKVRSAVPPSALKEYSLDWCPHGLSFDTHSSDIRLITADFIARIESLVDLGLKKRKLLDDMEREVVHHHSFAYTRSESFFGRETVKTAIANLVLLKEPIVRCVYGTSGSGKTSAMCVAARTARYELLPLQAVVIFRACGTSIASSCAYDLLRSLCVQISMNYGELTRNFDSFEAQKKEFHRLLALGSEHAPLVLFIDSLDQLTDRDNGRAQPWSWLPDVSIVLPHTKIIVSTLPDEKYGAFPAISARLMSPYPSALFEVRPLDCVEAGSVLDEWLVRRGRRVMGRQKEKVRQYLQNEKFLTMLHVRLLCDRIATWQSYDDADNLALPYSVQGLIDQIYADLERSYGVGLVSAVLGLLLSSRCGLSQDNIIDIISGDDELLGQKGHARAILQYHDPPVRRLPPFVFSRLRRGFQDYMVERGENGVQVLNLYHRQFWETGQARYLATNAIRSQYHAKLASFFSGNLAAKFHERGINEHPLRFAAQESSLDHENIPNRQKLNELPYALKHAGMYMELVAWLTDLSVIECFFAAGKSYAEDMLIFYSELKSIFMAPNCLSDTPQLQKAAEENLIIWSRFISKWFLVLSLQPNLLASLAANAPGKSVVVSSSKVRLDTGMETRPLIKWINSPKDFDACIQTQITDSTVLCCRLSQRADHYAIGTGATCIVFEEISSRQICQFHDHCGIITDICFSPNGHEVLSVARDTNAFIWSAVTGDKVKVLAGHFGWLTCCAWRADGEKILTGSVYNAIHIWDYRTGSQLALLEGHTGPVSGCTFLGSDKVFSGSEDGSARLWDMQSKAPMVSFVTDGAPVNDVAHSPDMSVLAVATNKSCALFSCREIVNTRQLGQLTGHKSEVWACCFSPNSKEIVTAGADRTCLVFDVATRVIVGKLISHSKWVMDVSWEGKYILSSSVDKSVKLYDRTYIKSSTEATADLSEPLMGFHLSEGGSKICVLAKTMRASVLDSATLVELSSSPVPQNEKPHNSRAYLSQDGNIWAFSEYDQSFYTLRSGKVSQHRVPVSVCNKFAKWSPTSNDLLVTGGDGETGLFIVNLSNRSTNKSIITKGWVMDVDWTSDSSSIVASCQDRTILAKVHSFDTPTTIGPASLCVALDHASRRAAIVTCKGKGYDVKPTGAAILDLNQTTTVLCRMEDPVLSCANMRQGNIRWSADDQYVFITSDASSVFGFPMVNAFSGTTGMLVTRFCSPYPNNFTNLETAVRADGTTLLAAVDEVGRIFVLELLNFESSNIFV